MKAVIAGSTELPLAVELRPTPDIESALVRLAALPHSLLLDSALREARLGRYSFLTADPFEYFEIPVGRPNALDQLQARRARAQATSALLESLGGELK